MLTVSLLLNVIVLVPVCLGIVRDRGRIVQVLGPREPGRQILLAMYLTILGLSVALLVWREESIALGLLLVQVAYKLLSPLTVGTVRHPVVLSNLAIAVVHSITLVDIWPAPG